MVTLVRCAPEQIGALEGRGVHFPVVSYLGVEGDRILGAGGLAWMHGRCFLWLGLVDMTETRAIRIVRAARKMIRVARQLGETTVYCWRDEAPHSAKLLALVGMTFHGMEEVTFADGSTGEKEVWKSQL